MRVANTNLLNFDKSGKIIGISSKCQAKDFVGVEK